MDEKPYKPRRMIRLDEPLGAEEEPISVPDDERETVRLPRASEDIVTEQNGVRFQKCGGGRRIIRKSNKGNY